MPAASILIKPSSANCNIDCNYCFYKCLSSNRKEYSKGFMSDETLEALIVQAFAYADGFVSFAFQGGEPTLAGLRFFKRVAALQKKYNTKHITIENTIQTNGILINDEWAEFLAENHFLVGLSLDGPKKIHDHYRQDTNGQGTFDRVMNAVKLLEQYRVPYNILTVVTNETAEKASYLYKFYKRNHFEYVQFIPCMDETGRKADTVSGISGQTEYCPASIVRNAEQYGRFLNEMFDLWYEDYMRGEQMDIRMFSNLAQMAAGYPAEECGMNGCCSCYFVVEGDGSVYPCDFYCMDQWKLGMVADGFHTLIGSERAEKFLRVSHHVSDKCKACAYFSLCRGGCRRWREPIVDGTLGLNALCSAYEIFFEHTRERIEKLGQCILAQYGPYRK